MASRAARAGRDPVRRGRTLWFAVSAAIDLILVGIGVGYALGGPAAEGYRPGFRVLLDFLPLGFYGHGWILVSLGMLNFWALARLSVGHDRVSWQIASWTARATLFYSLVVAACLIGAIWLNDRYDSEFWWYLGLAVLSGAVVGLPPEFKQRSRTGRA